MFAKAFFVLVFFALSFCAPLPADARGSQPLDDTNWEAAQTFPVVNAHENHETPSHLRSHPSPRTTQSFDGSWFMVRALISSAVGMATYFSHEPILRQRSPNFLSNDFFFDLCLPVVSGFGTADLVLNSLFQTEGLGDVLRKGSSNIINSLAILYVAGTTYTIHHQLLRHVYSFGEGELLRRTQRLTQRQDGTVVLGGPSAVSPSYIAPETLLWRLTTRIVASIDTFSLYTTIMPLAFSYTLLRSVRGLSGL